MGLLDSIFAPSTYSGSGGLLDFLRPSLTQLGQSNGFPDQPTTFDQRFNALPNAPQPVNPSGRQFDSAMFDPSTYAPNQARPIQIGNYQMPRVGSADLYNPQQINTPPNATPTQGQLPPQIANANAQAPQDQPLPPAFGGGSYLQRLNNGGGLIGSLIGDTPQQQNLKAQYDSLVPILGPQKAMLAVMNPEAGKTLLTEALTNKNEWGVINEDPLNGKQYGWIDKLNHTINGQPMGQNGAPAGQPTGLQAMTDRITEMRNGGATTEQLLEQIPTGYRDDVQALIEGRGVPQNMGRAQSRMAILTLAKAIDKNFDETLIPTRIQMRKDFAGEGKNGQAIGALNTVQHHADQVSDAIQEFEKAGGGSSFPLINAGKLMLANNTGMNPALRNAAEKLKNKLNATEHEVASAYNAGHITDADRKTWNEIKASDLPADQLREKLADFVELLNGKRDSLNHMYRQVFQTDAPGIDKTANDATTQKILSRRPSYAQEGASNKPQVVIQNGHQYTLQSDGSYK